MCCTRNSSSISVVAFSIVGKLEQREKPFIAGVGIEEKEANKRAPENAIKTPVPVPPPRRRLWTAEPLRRISQVSLSEPAEAGCAYQPVNKREWIRPL